ncbi:MAG: M20 family metallopeptidase [Anaerolineaceae bacterium]|nr:M20 family metallopeptidase [Anaerolineaceae bacterium]
MKNNNIFESAENNFFYSQKLRRDFHKNPELGFEEFRTSGIIAKELHSFGYEVHKGVGRTGVTGFLEGNNPGNHLLLRFDMDALPIQEENSNDYISTNSGVMHACGHDGHMSIGLTVAKIISEQKNQLNGTIKFVFQPAEEGLGGAIAMIQDGVLENPRPDYCLGLHIWNEKPFGWIGVNTGPMMAAADTFEIKIVGKGGHGGLPNKTIDPINTAAQIINAIQTIITRNISPLENAVISFGSVNGGSTFNVIPDVVLLTGTIRTFDPMIRELIIKRIEQICLSLGEGMGCKVEFHIDEITPAVVNNPQIVSKLSNVIQEYFPTFDFDPNYQSMVSEDFSFFLNQVPGCFFFVGSANQEKNLVFGHHHPKFDFDEKVIPVSVSCLLGMIDQLGFLSCSN